MRDNPDDLVLKLRQLAASIEDIRVRAAALKPSTYNPAFREQLERIAGMLSKVHHAVRSLEHQVDGTGPITN